jgi:hypothetical protein
MVGMGVDWQVDHDSRARAWLANDLTIASHCPSAFLDTM